ncbi:MAG: hypothetical protein KGV50_05995 [Gammaproteobacteria bacterium]|nr:hypothetical protein [Gammaproteobacteria bacterium]
MKKLLSILVLGSVALSVNAADNTATEESKAPVSETKVVTENNIPADCVAYYSAIEKLAEKDPSMGDKFKESMEASKKQWSATEMTEEQKTAANDSCKQALEQIKPML